MDEKQKELFELVDILPISKLRILVAGKYESVDEIDDMLERYNNYESNND